MLQRLFPFWLAINHLVLQASFTFPPVRMPSIPGVQQTLPPVASNVLSPIDTATLEIKDAADKIAGLAAPVGNLTDQVASLTDQIASIAQFANTQVPSIASQAFQLGADALGVVGKTTSSDNIFRISFIAGVSFVAGGLAVYIFYRIIDNACFHRPKHMPDWQVVQLIEKRWREYDNLCFQGDSLSIALAHLDFLLYSEQYVAYLRSLKHKSLFSRLRQQEIDLEKNKLIDALSRDFRQFMKDRVKTKPTIETI